MPYYSAGDYYGAGDYYNAGDFLGIGKALKKVSGFVGGLGIPVVSGVANAANKILGGGGAQIVPSYMMQGGGLGNIQVPAPGVTGALQRLVPGGKPGVGRLKKDGTFTDRARPRMNVTNVRALRRAGRRVKGFLRIANRLGALPIARSGGKKLFKRKRR